MKSRVKSREKARGTPDTRAYDAGEKGGGRRFSTRTRQSCGSAAGCCAPPGSLGLPSAREPRGSGHFETFSPEEGEEEEKMKERRSRPGPRKGLAFRKRSQYRLRRPPWRRKPVRTGRTPAPGTWSRLWTVTERSLQRSTGRKKTKSNWN